MLEDHVANGNDNGEELDWEIAARKLPVDIY